MQHTVQCNKNLHFFSTLGPRFPRRSCTCTNSNSVKLENISLIRCTQIVSVKVIWSYLVHHKLLCSLNRMSTCRIVMSTQISMARTHNVWMYEHFLTLEVCSVVKHFSYLKKSFLIGSPLPFHRRDINASLKTCFLFGGLLERPMAWKQLNSFWRWLQPFNESIEKLFNFYASVNPLPQSEISGELYALRYGGFPPPDF